MGRYGQAILTVVGTVVGAYFGYPALGATLGSLAGSLLFPTQLPTVQGPRLSDLTQTTSAVGTALPRLLGGTGTCAGTVIYKSDIREIIVSEDVGGKGGTEQTVETPTYFQDFAIALTDAEDPIADLPPIGGIRTIWANGKPIFDRRPRRDEETDSEFNQRIAMSNILEEQMTVYLGTEDQMPDPTWEADKGVGNVSGHRGTSYVMFRNWQNKPEDGNKMPINWKFEIYELGAVDEDTLFEYSNEWLPPWNATADVPLFDIYYGMDVPYLFNGEATGLPYSSGRGVVSGTWDSLNEAQLATARVALRTADNFMGYSITPSSGSQAARGVTSHMDPVRHVGNYDVLKINLHFNAINTTRHMRSATSFGALAGGGMAPGQPIHSNGYFVNNGIHTRTTAAVYQWWPGDYWSAAAYRSSSDQIDMAITTGRSTNPGAVLVTGDAVIGVTRLTRSPGYQCEVELPQMPGYCVSTRGNLVRKRDWERIEYNFPSNAVVLQRLTTEWKQIPGESINHRARVVTKYPLNPALPSTHPNANNQAFWEPYYLKAVALGEMEPDLVFGVDYPVEDDFIYRRELEQSTIETFPVPLDIVAARVLRESGYVPTDYDVTALEGLTLYGAFRTGVMPGRAVMDMLRKAKFFDGIESNGKIKFVRRGGAIVATLEDDDLGFTVAGEDAPSKLTTATADETTLPRSVRVHYLAPSRDYEPGEQTSPSRVETRATNDMDVEIPMPLEDEEAAKIAEILWAEAWAARRTHNAVIDGGRQELEPTDPIEVPVDGRMRRVRIVSIEDAFPAVRRLELVRDDDGSYISRAVGTTPDYTRPTLTVPSPAELVLLDLPALRDEDDDAGIYAAVRPYLTDSPFRGATITRSTDGGGSYTSLGPVGTAVPMGYLAQPLAGGLHTIWDEANTIRVQMQYGDLESRTTAAVLGGANAAAIGVHGRWEIVQFRDAVHVGDGVWTLTNLLRGRRGTEHNIGTAIAGDRFVMLSMGGLTRLSLNVAEIGAPRLYRTVAIGTRPSDAVPQEFTGQGEALKPFSPVHIKADLETDDDIHLAWIRRGRLGQTLQSGADIPLSEATEAYEVDVVIGGAVVRTIETTEQAATYTLLEQAEDFDSPAPAAVLFKVYQISATVGRGHVGELNVVLADLREEFGADVPPDELAAPDADAIIVPLVLDDVDEAVAPLTWTRLGDGPRITPAGMIGDGVNARLRATAGLPGYATSNSGNLYLRATITAYDCGARNATADRVVSVCVNDATANPRLEFAIVDDSSDADEPNIALRSFTGSMQTKRLSRREWRFVCTHPEKTRGGFGARPQGILFYDGTVLTCEHYENNFSTAHQVNVETGDQVGVFQFGAGLNHVSAIADRPSDAGVWFLDATTEHLLEVDVPASLASQAAVVLADVNVTALAGAVGLEWAVIGEQEVLLLAEGVSGLVYVFDAADVSNGVTLATADRIKRLQGPANCRGITYRAGTLYVATTDSGGVVHAIDFDAWFDTGTDDEAYAGYQTGTYGTPSAMVGDVDADEAGNLWMATEGRATVADDTDWFAVWQSPLIGSVENVYSAYYAGGSVAVRINDRPFCTLAWTPTPTPAAISIGGPPQASLGQTAGFFVGAVRDVVIQGTDYNPGDFDLAIVYENEGQAEEVTLTITNPDAEDGVNGWTSEVGTLTRRAITGVPPPYEGDGYFSGGNSDAHTTASQRLDLSELLDFDPVRLDAGDCWIVVQWHAAVFTAQTDQQAIGFRFLDASTAELADVLSPSLGMTPSATWIPRSYAQQIPAGTRFVELVMDMIRNDGANNDGYIDAITAAIYVPVPNE